MKEMTCIHPRKAYNLMRNFLNTASDLENTQCYRQIINPTAACEEWEFGAEYSITEKTSIVLRKSNSFQAGLPEDVHDEEELFIYYNYKELFNGASKLFRKFWVKECPMLKGFSDITISLLHELGHLETNNEIREVFPFEAREFCMFAIGEMSDSFEKANNAYFDLPDERKATEWAIEWLSDSENRKIAKQFEKAWFTCFE